MNNEPITPAQTEELKNLLRQNLAVADENNEILKRMVKIGRIAFWAKAIIWTIVLVVPLILIPYFLPKLRNLPVVGNTGSSTTLFGYPSPTEVQKAIQQYKAQK